MSGGLVIGLVAVVMGIWAGLRKTTLAYEFKRELLERGLSPEEIRLVMEARPKGAKHRQESRDERGLNNVTVANQPSDVTRAHFD